MKRVKAACICQTPHFMLKDDLGHDYAVKLVKEEVEKYKASLDKSRWRLSGLKRISLRHSIACSHWRKTS